MALLSPRLVPALRALSPRDTIGLLRLGINPEVCVGGLPVGRKGLLGSKVIGSMVLFHLQKYGIYYRVVTH